MLIRKNGYPHTLNYEKSGGQRPARSSRLSINRVEDAGALCSPRLRRYQFTISNPQFRQHNGFVELRTPVRPTIGITSAVSAGGQVRRSVHVVIKKDASVFSDLCDRVLLAVYRCEV